MLNVFILVSQREKKLVSKFWDHLAVTRRELPVVIFQVVYTEDILAGRLAPEFYGSYVLVCCLTEKSLDQLMEPIFGTIIENPQRCIPFVFSECQWEKWPSPFAGKMPLSHMPLSSGGNKNKVLAGVSEQLGGILKSLLSQQYRRR